jgi:WD40 repeat protein
VRSKGRTHRVLGGHKSEQYASQAAFVDKQLFSSGSDDGAVWVWNVQTKACAHFSAHSAAVLSVSADSHLRYLASAGLVR